MKKTNNGKDILTSDTEVSLMQKEGAIAVSIALLGGALFANFSSSDIPQQKSTPDIKTETNSTTDYGNSRSESIYKEKGLVSFPSSLDAEKKSLQKKIETADYIKETYDSLKACLGKNVYPIEFKSAIGQTIVYYNSKKEYNTIFHQYRNHQPSHKNNKEEAIITSKAAELPPFLLTEEKLQQIIKDYINNPMLPLEVRKLWEAILFSQN